MKKLLIFSLCATLSLTAAAQSWDQAQLFSENIYGGTARSIGMGNALTAVGGDPGSIGINPAGGAVAGYSQFFITPALSISATVAQGYSPDGVSVPLGYGDRVSTGYTRVKMPNLGFMMSINTGRRHGIKRISFGFTSNSTNDYTRRFNASGLNYGFNSYSGSLASLANGYTQEELSPTSTEAWFREGPAWEAMAGYMSGVFDYVDGQYLGVTDMLVNGEPQAAGTLYQKYGNQSTGYKHDVVMNFSFDVEDKFYFGANLGITTLAYSQTEYWQEMPADPSTFPKIVYDGGLTVATFNSLNTRRAYAVSGTGIYLKVGVLWRPVAGLRLGAAVQTPTWMNMRARCGWYSETSLSGISFRPSASPDDDWIYSLRLPFRWNAGAAYTFGKYAVLSVDYEMANYAHSRYGGRNAYGYSSGVWSNENADIVDALGLGHNLRVGLELKPIDALAIRFGYNYLSGSQVNWLDWEYSGDSASLIVTPLTDDERRAQASNMASFGLGYTFGSFYADFAVRVRLLPINYYSPYSHYTYDMDYKNKHVDVTRETPIVRVTSTGIDTVLSLGWRF